MPSGGPPASASGHARQRGARQRALLAAALLLLAALWTMHGRSSSSNGSGGGGALRAAAEPPPLWLLPAAGNWSHPLPAELLDQGMIYWGDMGEEGPARRLAKKLLAGQPISLVFHGGSLTMGHGASTFGRTDWPSLVGRWLRAALPAPHRVRNAAIPAAPSEYLSFCLQHYLPPEPDLIVLDYAVNNNAGPAAKPWVHNHPRSFERLMRRLARLPSRPLVLGFQLHSFNENHSNGTFHLSGEDAMGALFQYYRVPYISFRSVVVKPMAAGEPGFRADEWLREDRVHPNDRGQEYVAQLLVRYLQNLLARERDAAELTRCRGTAGSSGGASSGDSSSSSDGGSGSSGGGGSSDSDAGVGDRQGMAAAAARDAAAEGDPAAGAPPLPPLPPPMLPGAEAIEAEVCLHNARFRAAIQPGSVRLFTWEKGVGQPGHVEDRLISWKPGAQVTLRVDTDVHPRQRPGEQPPPQNATHVAAFLWFTHSHHYVGSGAAWCSGGCSCERQRLRPLLKVSHSSQDHLHLFFVTRSEECLITVKSLDETESGAYLFRLRGLVVSSVAAAPEALPTEYLWGEELERLPP